MKRSICNCVFVLICLSVFQSSMAAERQFYETFSVTPSARISLDSHRGQVVIRTWPQNDIQFRATARHPSVNALERLTIDVDREGANEIEIEIDSLSPWFALSRFAQWDSLEIDYEIVVPAQASLDLDGHDTDFQLDAPSGSIEIEARRGSGKISSVLGPLKIETKRSDFEIDVSELARLEVKASRGSFKVNLKNAQNFSLDTRVSRGELSVTGRNFQAQEERRSQLLRLTEGDARHSIAAEVNRGNLHLNFLD